MVKKTSIKKTPDIAEIGLNGSMEEKLSLAKQLMEKEIAVDSILAKNQLVDIRGITKGRGTEGPVRRFGIAFRQHKSEKGVRKAGSLGPWKPSRLSFRTPLMGQVGFFTRPQYNSRVISLDHDTNKINQKGGFHHYGMLHNHYVLVKGSVNGPAKRVILLTAASRPSKGTVKENFEIVSILK
jgi:large subunit ribosomal protein L3